MIVSPRPIKALHRGISSALYNVPLLQRVHELGQMREQYLLSALCFAALSILGNT
jgi:hypothetical protein